MCTNFQCVIVSLMVLWWCVPQDSAQSCLHKSGSGPYTLSQQTNGINHTLQCKEQKVYRVTWCVYGVMYTSAASSGVVLHGSLMTSSSCACQTLSTSPTANQEPYIVCQCPHRGSQGPPHWLGALHETSPLHTAIPCRSHRLSLGGGVWLLHL